MNQSYPVPPPELVEQWREETCPFFHLGGINDLATKAAQWGYQQRVRSGPESPLVERVADAIAAQATSAGIVNDRPARAAILQVALWLREQGTPALGWAMLLERDTDLTPSDH